MENEKILKYSFIKIQKKNKKKKRENKACMRR